MSGARRVRIAVLAAALSMVVAGAALARFTDVTSVGSNTLATATLQPPTDLATDPGCDLVLVEPKVDLTWTASVSERGDGYKVIRSTTSGGPYTEVGSVLDLLTTSFTDLNVNLDTTYYYVVDTFFENWTARSAEVTATTPLLCA